MESTLSPEARIERAKLAVNTRWKSQFNWETSSMESCHSRLAALRAEAEKGGLILQRRMDNDRVSTAICYNPDCHTGPDHTRATFEISRAVGSRSRISQDTGLMETAYVCSAACYLYLSANFKHQPAAAREDVTSPIDNVNNQPAERLV